jgi:hypothetical protein
MRLFGCVVSVYRCADTFHVAESYSISHEPTRKLRTTDALTHMVIESPPLPSQAYTNKSLQFKTNDTKRTAPNATGRERVERRAHDGRRRVLPVVLRDPDLP